MKAARVTKLGHIELVDVDKPTLEEGKALLKVEVVAVCGSDLRLMYHGAEGWPFPLPVGAPAHECIGVVEECDSNELEPGERVLAIVGPPTCLAEYRLVDLNGLIKVPSDADPDHLVMAQPLGTVLWACRRVNNIIGKDVVVLGQGGIGLLFNVVLRRMGAREVIGVDVKQARLDMGLKMGATETVDASARDVVEAVDELTGGEMADVVVEAAGEPETIGLSYKLAKSQGQLVLFGIPRFGDVFELDYLDFFGRYLSVFSSSDAQSEPGLGSFRVAVDLVGRGEIDVSPMLTHCFSFTGSEVQRAFDLAYTRKEGVGRPVIHVN